MASSTLAVAFDAQNGVQLAVYKNTKRRQWTEAGQWACLLMLAHTQCVATLTLQNVFSWQKRQDNSFILTIIRNRCMHVTHTSHQCGLTQAHPN